MKSKEVVKEESFDEALDELDHDELFEGLTSAEEW